MTRFFIKYCYLLLLICSAAQADEITLVADEWCPINCAVGDSREGIFIEVARKIFEPKGHRITYKILPWSRAVEEVRKGHYTGAVGTYPKENPDFVFPDSILRSGDEYFVLKDNPWRYQGIESLEHISLGVVQGYEYDDETMEYVEKHIKNPKRIQVISGNKATQSNVKKLLAKRVDVVLEDRLVMKHFLRNKPFSDEIVAAGATELTDLYIGFSPANPKSESYAKLLTEGLRKLKESGEFQKILDSYGVS